MFQQCFDLRIAFDRIGLADEHVDAFDIELMKPSPQFSPGFGLDHVTIVQQFQHRLAMGDVAEVGRQQRIECLRNQSLHVAKSLNHVRGPLVVDVHDHRQGQPRFERIASHQVDRPQAFVVAMGLGLARNPVQYEVGRRYERDLAGIGVEGVLARPKWPFPHAPFSFRHPLAVSK